MANTTNTFSSLLTASACVLAVSGVPGFAQTHTVHREAASGVVRVYVADRSPAAPAGALAPNLTVTSLFTQVVAEMLRRSPTFRRQCQKLAAAPHVRVDVQSTPQPRDRMDAWTSITRDAAGAIRAAVSIAQPGRAEELIAHELEHVLEQIDGLSLAEMARVRGSGVRHCDCGADEAYETIRAVRVGQQVAAEMGAVRLEARRFGPVR